LCWLVSTAMAFQTMQLQQRIVTSLDMSTTASNIKSSVIYADDSDFQFDPGQGGVRLAQESALMLSGKVATKKKGAEATPSQFTRYTQLTPLTEAQVQDVLTGKQGGVLMGVGSGKELYKDPGNGSDQVIELAPLEAARDLLNTLSAKGSLDDSMDYVVNILGGHDMQVLEVLNALEQLRENLFSSSKVSLSFNSLSHESFPLEQVTMTLVGLPADASASAFREKDGDNAIAQGRVFFQDGNYCTVAEGDLNPDLI